ncbi:hypothetical protein [Sphingomonas nostoxanthinifaciens]|uniref:hypothetical protein n=1 Tax=Sphingomonas nostoxanthinifaciens TaxID=2872652 RepID=UPI001CC1F624|nr:hypothetical protein [Sphingomonas nostoxanthinifaciens]UAK25999.1 hypothetical protein K8P63_07775 [Sphingomonas nostoxanthinifaciens]
MKLFAAAIFAILSAPAIAQDATCTHAAVEPGFDGWGKPAGDTLAPGKAATLALKPATEVTFEPKLARAPKPGSFGGFFAITVPAAGTYRFALSQGAWIDAVHRGDRLKSVAHGHGAACSGIAKIVAFELPAGRSYIQLSEAKAATIDVMVVKG